MAQAQSPETFANGQQVTATRLNNHVNGLLLLPGAITDQSALTANTLATGDEFLINDASASALRKVAASSILNSGIAITTGSVTGSAGADLVITPDAAYELEVAGDTSVTGDLSATGDLTITGASTLTGNVLADNNLTVNGKGSFASTGAVQIPAGTTAQRPGSAVQGDLRYNTTTSKVEVYGGSTWDSPVQNIKVATIYLSLPDGTSHPISTANAWTSVPLNSLTQSEPFVVNSASFTGVGTSNTSITLPAGTYYARASVSSYRLSRWIVARIFNASNSTQIAKGYVTRADTDSNVPAYVETVFTLTSQSIINIQYFCNNTGTDAYPNISTEIGFEVLFPVTIMKLS